MEANRTRIKFSKTGRIKFIGHLDLLMVFQQAIKRAGLPVSYSKGFNPHQLLYFAQPLPLGMESQGEYVDVLWDVPLDMPLIIQKLNSEMPQGIKILNGLLLSAKDKKAAAVVQAASYRIDMEEEQPKLSPPEEMREGVFAFEMESPTSILATLATGSTKNLNPKLLMSSLAEGVVCRYTRLDLFMKKDGLFVSLLG